ncbi:MAG: hypothetical protein IJ762_06450 [Bacteroidaceae bacterium]|nr:hypothetical protein [Bacteroidaceae bacterium]
MEDEKQREKRSGGGRRLLAALTVWAALAVQARTVPLRWVGAAPEGAAGVTLGVPFPKGEMKEGEEGCIVADGQALPTDFWPLAYWPDGSVKWGAAAARVPAGCRRADFRPGQTPAADDSASKGSEGLKLSSTADGKGFCLSTGPLRAYFSRRGEWVADSLVANGRRVAERVALICSTQSRPDAEGAEEVRFAHYTSRIDTAYVERKGRVRAVVRIDGHHTDGQRRWLPFTVRLYFFRGCDEVRMVHTFVFDGDAHSDFIRSLGVRFGVPLHEQLYNRHVAFATEKGGVWAESVQPLSGRRMLGGDAHWETEQVAGRRVPEPESFDGQGRQLLQDWASWNGFRLSQPNDQGFSITKRAHADNPWIGTLTGQRAGGYAFVGDVEGGLGVGLRNFWQSYPAGLQVDDATGERATLTVWLWSPDAPPMDLRHYDNRPHGLTAAYEDVQEGMSTPYGIARTSELTLVPSAASRLSLKERVAREARRASEPPVLLPTPEYLHDCRAFGIWSLPDTVTERRRRVEDQLAQYLDYYLRAQDEHRWYGFWNYGDFMHQYDPVRHSWKYDVGGFAWDNTELGTPSWLWYSFLRTGRADLWQAATAMTRHTSEVDVYHLGEMAGLGSRHNVSHWGCGAKEARISQAAWNRFMYYLTADERLGDLMTAVRDADQKLYAIDPMRLALPREKYPCTAPARLRVGPDWLAYAGNWMTEWERTRNPVYRKKIEAGMKSIAHLPHGFFTGPGVLGFDPATGRLSWEGGKDVTHTEHLVAIMGGFEIQHELDEMLPDKAWQRTWLEFCRDYDKRTTNPFRVSRLKAYAAWKLNDKGMAEEAWRDMWTYSNGRQHYPFEVKRIEGCEVPHPIDESPQTTTNDCALWSLEAIFMQEVLRFADRPEPDR